MRRNTIAGITAIVVILAAILGYAALGPQEAQPVWLDGEPVMTPAALTGTQFIEHAPYYDIDINYASTTPLSGDANDAALMQMKIFISDTISEFKNQGNFDNLTPNAITTMGFDKGRKEKLQMLYLIASSPHTISYLFTIYEDTLGAHGNMFFHTFIFNTSTGAPLALADVFLPDSNYLETLSSMSRAKLPAIIGQYSNADFFKSGTMPDEKNFQNFFFDNRDFVILFPPYQVAAFVAGPQTLRIPLSELSGILRPEYR
jgi:hypothetical protein